MTPLSNRKLLIIYSALDKIQDKLLRSSPRRMFIESHCKCSVDVMLINIIHPWEPLDGIPGNIILIHLCDLLHFLLHQLNHQQEHLTLQIPILNLINPLIQN